VSIAFFPLYSEPFFNTLQEGVEVENTLIGRCPIGKPNTQRKHNGRAKPSGDIRRQGSVFGTVFCKNSYKMVGKEYHNGHHHGKSHSPFSNDCTQGRSHKKQYYTGHSQYIFFV